MSISNGHYDVIIVGAGPAGSSAGYYLASHGLKVLLLDKFAFPRDKTCGDALTPRALRVLDDMRLLDTLLALGQRVTSVSFVAPNGHTATAPIPRQEEKADTLLFVPRFQLDAVILDRARATGAAFQGPVRVTNIVYDDKELLVEGETRQQFVSFKARMVILAVGANTKLLLRTGILKKQPPMMLCARSYYEEVQNMPTSAQCRFDGVPLPGYGWAFPLTDARVNAGVGLFRTGIATHWMPRTAQSAYDTFLQTSAMQNMLQGAKQVGPVKGYPLRVDFAHAPTFADRILLVGEAAGLVNPVTGEGIDYALESGKMAAEHLIDMFAMNDLSVQQLKVYDQRLRRHYQRLFVLCDALRLLYLNPLFLNRVIKAASHNEDLMTLFMNIAIENQDIYEGLSPQTLARVLFERSSSSYS